jgi:hypothetical protein
MSDQALHSPTVDELLTHPKSFERRDFSSYLFRPFSIKERRAISLYTPAMYVLWLRLESDPEVRRFNTEVSPVPISIGRNGAISAAPRCVSVGSSGIVTIHTFDKILAPDELPKPDEATATFWEEWAFARGFQHRPWSPDELFANEVYLSNLGRLLGYTSRPGFIPNIELEERILSELRGYRRTTFAKLAQQFTVTDPEMVNESIASLIVARRVFSDITSQPFSMVTMLSAFRDVAES